MGESVARPARTLHRVEATFHRIEQRQTLPVAPRRRPRAERSAQHSRRLVPELEARGFIRKTCDHHLGPSGIGQASTYALEEETCDGKPASKAYMSWRANSGSPREI